MKKEIMMVLLLVLLPTLFIMNFGGNQSTGAVVNEIEKLRLERLKYMTFPTYGTGLSDQCKFTVKQIRDTLRKNTDQRFFDYLGLRTGQLFYKNEKELFSYFISLLYLRQSAPGQYVGIKDVLVTITQPITIVDTSKIGLNYCTEDIAMQAAEVLVALADWNMRIMQKTIDLNKCPDQQEALRTMDRAKGAYNAGDYDVFFIELETAWKQGAGCNEVLQV